MAVRVWPNSSCSSRARWRSVDSRAVISCCATSRRSRDSVASSAKSRLFESHHVEAGDDDGGEGRGEESVDLPLGLIVDARDARRRPSFTGVVVDQEPRDGGSEGGLPRLERQSDFHPRVRLVSVARQGKDAVRRVPELRQRVDQVLPLLRRAAGGSKLRFTPQGVVEIAANPLKRHRPGRERIRLSALGVEHVPHGETERVEIVLNPQQLQRVLPVAIGERDLELSHPADLPRHVVRIRRHGGEGDHHSGQQSLGRRPRLLRAHAGALLQQTRHFPVVGQSEINPARVPLWAALSN